MSEALWSFADLLAITHGRPVGPEPESITGISIDSRTIKPGEAFFAIRGDHLDGHDFVSKALASGAATAVIDGSRLTGLARLTGSRIAVDDVMEAMNRLAAAARARSSATVVAVTGSVGKTGTKDMLMRALRPSGSVHGATASFNNHWGVPLTLARMPPAVQFGVFEIGMNHAGEILPLAQLVRPHLAIVTAVEAVHIEYFDSVEGIARAKAEIFAGVEPGGTAVINRDNPYFDLLNQLAGEAGVDRVLGFGEHRESFARLERADLRADHSTVYARILDERITYRLGAPGRHLVQNSLAVLAAVAELGADLNKAMVALAAMTAPKGRGDRHRLSVGGGAALLIDESYNANPASTRAAIALLGRAEPESGGRRIAVLGDMLELGEAAPALHAELAEPLQEAGVDRVYLAGPLMEALWQALPSDRRGAYCEAAAGLEAILSDDIAAGDVIMIKGSNGSRMGPLAERLKQIFADQMAEPAASEADRPGQGAA